uniref:Uncharacterized protein n=1 Tax=Anguilla anguilla TaxID=7936 RepID=A0A0E9R1A8_ANGAN
MIVSAGTYSLPFTLIMSPTSTCKKQTGYVASGDNGSTFHTSTDRGTNMGVQQGLD